MIEKKVLQLDQAGFQITSNKGSSFIINPWLKETPLILCQAEDIPKADIVPASSDHFDHTVDASVLKRKPHQWQRLVLIQGPLITCQFSTVFLLIGSKANALWHHYISSNSLLCDA